MSDRIDLDSEGAQKENQRVSIDTLTSNNQFLLTSIYKR